MVGGDVLDRACAQVRGFRALLERYKQYMAVIGRSPNTIQHYSKALAAIALYHHRLPHTLSVKQVEAYLHHLQVSANHPSLSIFKHAVFALRSLMKSLNRPYSQLRLPSIKHDKRLPVVLSKQEVSAMLAVCNSLKHRILICLLYGCGLRNSEVRNIRLRDLHFDRGQLHVVSGKGRKDRYVPLSKCLVRDLKRYIRLEQPSFWLFGSTSPGQTLSMVDRKYSSRGVQWVVRTVAVRAGINRVVTVHTLRHSFATHLIDDGMDILTLQQLLGHESLRTTIGYLHISIPRRSQAFSPLDTLHKIRKARIGYSM